MRRVLPILVLTASIAAAACGGDDSTGVSGNGSITQAESIAVSSALFTEVGKAMASATFSNTAGGGQMAVIMPSFSFNANCTSGGTISGNGTYTSNSYDLTYTPNNCKVQSTKTFVVNGDPNIHMTWTVPTSQSGTFNYTVKGGFKWDGGSCQLDYTIAANGSTGHGSIKGSMCGNSVDTTY